MIPSKISKKQETRFACPGAQMTSAAPEPADDDHVAANLIASLAGERLLALRSSGLAGTHLKDAGDRSSHMLIMEELVQRFPDDGVLSEEGIDCVACVDRRRVWIIDPLDGTCEFTLGTGGPLSSLSELDRPPRVLVSRTRPTEHALLLAERLGGELIPMGSAGAKAMAVVLGEADVYAHSGGQYEWDTAAPVAVAASAGLHVSRLDGSPLEYNRPDPWSPDVLVCRPELAADVIAIRRAA